MQKLVPDR